MRTPFLGAALCSTLVSVTCGLAVTSTALGAQQPPAGRQRARALGAADATACSQRARLLTLTLIDAATAAPINDATVTLTRRDRGDTLHMGYRLPARDGAWVFVEDGEVSREEVRPGLAVVLYVRRPDRPVVRRQLTLGLDPRGCHLSLVGPDTLRV